METQVDSVVEVTLGTSIILSKSRLQLLLSGLEQIRSQGEPLRLCVTDPPMAGIIRSMIAGSGAFWLPKAMKLKDSRAYTPRYGTTLTSNESPVQLDVMVFERDNKDPLVLFESREKLGNCEPLIEVLKTELDYEWSVVSDETLFRNVLLEKDLAQSRVKRYFFRPWKLRSIRAFLT